MMPCLLGLGATDDSVKDKPLCLFNGRDGIVDYDICLPF